METNSNVALKEARSEVRTVLRCNATVLFKDAPPISARTIDVSVQGICLLSPSHVAPGTMCGIRFATLINGKTVKVEVVAKVAYSICVGTTGFRIGHQFTDVDAANKLAINQITS